MQFYTYAYIVQHSQINDAVRYGVSFLMLFALLAYRVLLTRARQGRGIFIPQGDLSDVTHRPEYYDATYNYLRRIGICEI